MAVNIDIEGWISGAIITVMAVVMYFLTASVNNVLLTFATSQGDNVSATAWNLINFFLNLWNFIIIVFAASGIIYIIYTSIREKTDTRYY